MKRPLLELRDVSVSLSRRKIVTDASPTFPSSGLVALVGPNGAGKTTLVKAIAGVTRFSGDISIMGDASAAMSAAERARRVGYLPQGHVIHWPLPAKDIVALGRYAHGARDPGRLSAADAAAVRTAMQASGTIEFADRPVTELSGGERARVALARVLAAETPVILADEPIASLDPRYQLTVMAMLKSVAASGRLVIVVMHDLALAWRYADRIVAMQEGRIAADGAPADVLSRELLRAIFGVEAEWVHARDGTHLVAMSAA